MPETWYKVDNVAKVFLASVSRRDPRVFRVSCTLNEDVDYDCLNQALEQTARENPQFQVTLHRGLFWHYFESTNLKPQAVPETLAPCAMLYGPQIKNELLYRVSYYGARINVEMFHAISDGNGGMVFLKTLVHNYLQLKNPGQCSRRRARQQGRIGPGCVPQVLYGVQSGGGRPAEPQKVFPPAWPQTAV